MTNHMGNIMKTLIIALVSVLALSAVPAFAQTSTYSTITTTAVNATQLCFVLAATTNMQASGALSGPGGTPQEWDLWFDGEFAKINSVNTTSNQVCVMRGKSPTRAGTHATAVTVFYGPAGKVPFILGAPDVTNPGPATQSGGQFGSCVSTNYAFLPLINTTDGSIWNCLPTVGSSTLGTVNSGAYGRWVSYGFRLWTAGHPVTTIVDAAYTATLADEFLIMSRMTAARTITLPAITGILGKTMIIKNNTESALTITVAASANQGVSTTGSTTLAVNASTSGLGNVARLISVATSAGGWSWATW